MKKILLLAAAFYLLLAPLTFHTDNKLVLNWASQDNGKVWNIWSYGDKNLAKTGQFNYPPLHFYLDKAQYLIAKPIGGEGFYEWLSSSNNTDNDQASLARYSLAIKTPIIIFGLIAAYLLFLISKQFGANENQALAVSALWLFNPITMYSIPIMGQNDVMAIVFFLAAWFFLNSRKVLFSSLLFGLGASVKMFPLLWLPFLLLVDTRLSIKQKLKTFFYSVSVYLLTLLPFISSPAFRENAFNSGIDRMFMSEISLGFGDRVLIVPFLLMLIVAGVWSQQKNSSNKTIITRQAIILLLLNMIMIFFNHFHPQWVTWLIPFWAIWIINQKKKQIAPMLLLSVSAFLAWLLIVFLFNDTALSTGLLVVLNPHLATLPTLRDLLLSRSFDTSSFNNYAHTWLAGLSIIFLINWMNGNLDNSGHKLLKINWLFSKTKKINLYIMSLLVSLLLIFGITFTANMIPVVLTGPSPKITSYPVFTETVEKEFIASYDDLNRLNLFFSNADLKNRDSYQLVILDDQREVVMQQIFSGFNTGHESILRFNIPPQANSQDKTFFIKIIPPEESESPLRIASTESDNQHTFAIHTFYQQPRGMNLVKFAVNETVHRVSSIAEQLYGLFIAIPILLWLAL